MLLVYRDGVLEAEIRTGAWKSLAEMQASLLARYPLASLTPDGVRIECCGSVVEFRLCEVTS